MARLPNVPDITGQRPKSRRRTRTLLAIILSTLLVLGLGVGWFEARDRIGDQADQAAGKCVEGKADVPIIASPDIAEALGEIAKRYNDTHPVVRDHCVNVQVRAGDSRITVGALRGKWDTEAMGAYPAAWIPQSSIWAAELAVGKPQDAQGAPDSLVTSPVVLALPGTLAAKVRGKLAWGKLPALTQQSDALAEYGLPAWGSLRLAMPTGASSDATALAAQAIAAGIARTPGQLTAAKVKTTAVTSGVNAVLSSAPKAPDGTAAATVSAMSKGDQRKGLHAVPITEQQLFQVTKSTPEMAAKIRAARPGGATPVADYPVVRLSGEQVSTAQSDGVASFLEFAKQPAQIAVLTALGYRAARRPLPKGNASVVYRPVRRVLKTQPAAAVSINKLVYPS
ncbi:MAG: hypothetical protein QM728_07710 [Gordonia sp. (in: high G+C Gram-positive bacteria)]|uniref:hypothetical protein n=1 Tax=Gordonia sp. (in: high G+C Gram-positive bacteria) TaxID=84139 RepID=UPI0039E6D7BB